MTESPDATGMDALSFGQRRMWFLNRLEGRVATYSLPYALRLSGDLDVPALRAALADVIGRHELLRTVYPELDGLPAPRVLEPELACPELPVVAVTEDELPDRLAAEVAWGFDIRHEPPIRAELYRLAPDTHVLLLVIHHVATDEWSNGVLARDLRTAYEARLRGTPPDRQPLKARYADHAVRQRALATEKSLAYWREALAGLPDEIDLPTDRPRPAVGSYRGGSVPLRLDAELHASLLGLARTARVSLFMVLQAALAALLTRLGAGTDIPIGTPVAGRGDPAYDDVVGYFVNSLVLRTDTHGDPTFRELLRRVRDRDLAAYAHQDTPFEQLVEDLAPPRSLARNPLFQTMLTLLPADVPWELPGLRVTSDPVGTATSPFDLAVTLWQRQDADGRPAGLNGAVDYGADLFDAPTVAALAERLVRLLAHVVEAPDTRIGQVDVLTPAERRNLTAWNDTARPVPETSLGGLVAARAARCADAMAVFFEGSSWTYAELDVAANRVAHRLVRAGAGPESVVGICAERSLELVAGLLGVLKSGAAYLPLDPEHPAERTGFMLADSGAPIVLAQRRFADRIPAGVDVLTLDDPDVWTAMPETDPRPVVPPDSAAYLMYTSGSTGRPKGVLVPHRAIVSQVTWLGERFPLRPDDRYLQHLSTSFDASLMELFLPLSTGTGLVLARPGGQRDLAYLAGLVRERRVTTMGLVPSALAEFLRFLEDADAMESIRTLRRHFTGGEALTGEFAARWRERTGVPLFHFYGPTEATVQVTCWGQDEDPEVPAGARVPIGSLVGNVQARVLDERLREVPITTPGQLYVGGVQVARGYHGLPGLTARRFVADPYGGPGDRMYATGDLVRWNRDGRLEFLGRIDDQVKVRGFRIELGEIESVLHEHPGVRDCAAALKDGRLVAYVTGEVDTAELPATLERRLPDYMVPAAFVTLPELPRSPSGKLEPAALPAPDFAARTTGGQSATPAEDLFRRLFAEVLGLREVGTTDSFFDLGGDSIVSLRLVSSARRAGMRISTRDVFQRKTPAGLAAVAEATGVADPADGESGVGEFPLTPVMRFFDERGMLAGRYAQSVVVPVPAGLNGTRLTAGLQAVLDRHDMLRGRLVDGPRLEVREVGAVAAGGCVRRVDAAGLDDAALRQTLAEQGRAALDRLDPRAGEMVRAVWLDRGPGRPGHLLLVVHHLAVDGVSWRIIVPDLTAAWQAIAAGRAPRLDPVPTSFGHWARLLAERAEDDEELPLWRRILAAPDPLLGRRPLDPRRDTVAELGRTSVTVPPEKTVPLLTVAAAYGAGVHEVLLAGLTVAVARWRHTRGVRHTALLVDAEGHGREPLTDDVDLSRTVGWFTTVYPVRLDPGAVDLAEARDGGRATGQVIKRVKEQLRALPRGGLGHGLLRHLNPCTATELAAYAAPQVAFNYLGRFDTEDAAGTVDLAAAWDETLPPTHTLEVTALVHADDGGPCLRLSLAWVPGALDQPDVADLAREWLAALDGIGVHAAHLDTGGLTPSDVPLVSLTQDDLDDLEAEYGTGLRGGGAR